MTAFATIETRLASATLAAFENIRLLVGAAVIGGVLDRAVDSVGEYGFTGERRDRLTVKRADASAFANGLAIQADPSTYSVAELAAMERTSWTLDRVDADDGQVAVWWLK